MAAVRRFDEFVLFGGDRFARLLGYLPGRRLGLVKRVVALVLVTWAVPAALAWRAMPGLGEPGRESFFRDLATYSQFLGFIPLAMIGEAYISSKMRHARQRLEVVAPVEELDAIASRAEGWARDAASEALCVGLAVLLTWAWALDEVSNGEASWHTALDGGGEHFTAAGLWIVFVSLPLFTYLWLRWVWKITVWTLLLYRVSRLDLRLEAAHPDRTGGLGCLSDVQTSFAVILFGTGILFAAATYYKVNIEGTPVESYTVWAPIVGYVILAPAVFLAPLFLFTLPLYRVREEALVRYTRVGALLASRVEQRYARPRADEWATSAEPSALADLRETYEAVQRMRVVPFDLRSVAELFGAAAGPFLPLADLLDLGERLEALLDLL